MKNYVYVMANEKLVLYIGVTSDLVRRVNEHKQNIIPGFTAKYKLHKLLYFEEFDKINDAIAREKQLKNWHREWKLNLIKEQNPLFEDIFFRLV